MKLIVKTIKKLLMFQWITGKMQG